MKNKKLFIAMYHYVRDLNNSRYPAIKGLDYPLFKQQIEFFEQNFHVVTMEQVLEFLFGGGYLPEKALLLTFDDGYLDHYSYVLPILKAHQMQGSFFMPGKTFAEDTLLDVNKIHFILASAKESELLEELYRQMDYYRGKEYSFPSNQELFQEYGKASRFDTAETVFIKRMLQTVLPEELRTVMASNLFRRFVGLEEKAFSRELYMNRDQIRMMKMAGMYIGLHGYDHYWLANLPYAEMKEDVEKALDVLDEWIDRKAWVMNYPYGNTSQEVIRCIAEHGCVLGLTTEVRAACLGVEDPYRIPRLDCNDFPPKSSRYHEFLSAAYQEEIL